MLAVFDPAVAPSPEGLRQPGAAEDGSAAGLADRFREARPEAVTVNLGGFGAMAYSSHGQSPLLPRYFFLSRLCRIVIAMPSCVMCSICAFADQFLLTSPCANPA